MKNYVRAVSFVLLILMLVAAFVGCAKQNNEDRQETEAGTNADETVAETTASVTEIPTEAVTRVPDIEVEKWDGREYRILAKGHDLYDIRTYVLFGTGTYAYRLAFNASGDRQYGGL
jgi:hypothetical protein